MRILGRYRADETRSPGGKTRGTQRELAYRSCVLIGGVKKQILRIDNQAGRRIQVANSELDRRRRKAWTRNRERPHRPSDSKTRPPAGIEIGDVYKRAGGINRNEAGGAARRAEIENWQSYLAERAAAVDPERIDQPRPVVRDVNERAS